MKKSLLALAALSAFATAAQAQSSVSVYGILSTGYESMKYSDGVSGESIKQTTTGRQGAQAGSRLGFRGTEDLGGGTTAGFTLEMAADMTTGLGAVRVGFMDLGNKQLGTLRAGRVDSLTRQVVNTYTSHANSGFEAGNTAASAARISAMNATRQTNAFNDGMTNTSTALSSAQSAAIATAAADTAALTWGQAAGRTSNTIGYISPSFNGVQFQAQIGKVESDMSDLDNKTVAQDTQAFGVSYNAGKLSVMAATSTEKSKSVELGGTTNAGDTKNKTDIIGATYDFGVAKAFAMYTDRELSRANGVYATTAVQSAVLGANDVIGDYNLDQKDTTLGVTVPVGAKVVLVGSYSMGELKGEDGKADFDGYQLQFNYNLSKRTKAYVMYGETKLKSDDGTDKLKGYVAGVQHSF
jgi:predicted porin